MTIKNSLRHRCHKHFLTKNMYQFWLVPVHNRNRNGNNHIFNSHQVKPVAVDSLSTYYAGGLPIESQQPTSATDTACREHDRLPC